MDVLKLLIGLLIIIITTICLTSYNLIKGQKFKIYISSRSVNPDYTITFVSKLFLDNELKSTKYKKIVSVIENPCDFVHTCPNYVMIISDNR